jgi:glycosyltransferase involved in cell wall biosynthesis
VARTLSVLIPVHNEERTLATVLDRVEARPEVSELVIVDDASTDRTAKILADRSFRVPVRLIRQPRNRGKGAAVRAALEVASGDLALIQDADLEYDPADYPRLLEPFDRPDVTAVFGTRNFTSHNAYSFWFVIGGKLTTLWNNLLFNTYLSDMHGGYKVMPLALWRELDLRSDGFDMDSEVTAKLLRGGHRIYEVPISYAARTREEGKKLRWHDGLGSLWTLTRIRAGR